MTIFIIMLVILLIVAAIVSPFAFFQVRKIFRDQKNFERGLKMVPLLIHLPPPSDDTEVGNRDTRDLADENISKAQILYNIIASTIQKGLKSRFYGQRHFTFEIIGSKGFVRFYTAVPVALVDVVKQALVSAYPAVRLEEVSEHNIFSPVGKISGTIGGELTLKEHYAYPIATYQDLKRDAMQSLLNALSTLDKEDGLGIQILMRPANPEWRKTASEVAGKKRKGKDSKKGLEKTFSLTRDLLSAFSKPPEDKKGGGGGESHELSGLDQAILDSIDDKTRHPGYEVLIRVVASSNVSQRAQAILSNVVATFALFDAPGKNGFKYTPAKDIERFVTSYIMRFFPQENNKSILNSVELATLFHFPDQKNIPTSQLQRQASKQVDGPRNISDEGIMLGYNVFRGVKKEIKLALPDRQRHMYVIGQTGTGKSTMLENLAFQDMVDGEGFAFIDPHGDSAEKLLALVPRERTEDVIYFSPADMGHPMGLNLFEFHAPEQKDFLIQEAINMLYKLYDPNRQGMIGARFEHIFRNCALALMSDPQGGTFVDIPKLLVDPAFLKAKLKHVTDQNVLDFWTKEWPASQRSNESGEVTSWVASKFGAFLSNEMMRNIIGQTKSAFNLREIMDNKKILIVNLSKGRTGELNSKLLGMVFVMKFQAAAMSRANVPESERKDFCLYVDEFQNFSTDSFATIMSEARKYHLNLIVANQFTTQLSEEIRDAVFGNMGTIIAFRVGDKDVDALVKYFQPSFELEDLLRVPNYNAIVRTLVGGIPTHAFSMSALPPLGSPNPQLAQALKQLSAAKYGRPKAIVEAEVFSRLAVKEEPKPSFGSTFNSPYPPQSAGNPLQAPPKPGASSFLDDWLAKRKAPAAPSLGPTRTPATSSPQPPIGVSSSQPSQQPSPVIAPVPGEPEASAADDPTSAAAPVLVLSQDDLSLAKAQDEKAAAVKESADLLAADKKESKQSSTHGEIKISRNSQDANDDDPGDTIFIDKEGNLHTKKLG